VVEVLLANMGCVPASFVLTAEGTGDWALADAAGAPLAVPASGWRSPLLAPGAGCRLRATLILRAGAAAHTDLRLIAAADHAGTPTDGVAISLRPQQPSAVSLTVTPAVARPVGMPRTLQAHALAEGALHYWFRVGRREAQGGWRWSDLQRYAPSATCPWVPTEAGAYALAVYAREARARIPYAAYRVCAAEVLPALTGVQLRLPATPPLLANTPVALQAIAQGAAATYWFRVGERRLEGGWQWETLQAPTTAATALWHPRHAGAYVLAVYARAPGSPRQFDVYSVQAVTVR
jgi:hypothetical protein